MVIVVCYITGITLSKFPRLIRQNVLCIKIYTQRFQPFILNI